MAKSGRFIHSGVRKYTLLSKRNMLSENECLTINPLKSWDFFGKLILRCDTHWGHYRLNDHFPDIFTWISGFLIMFFHLSSISKSDPIPMILSFASEILFFSLHFYRCFMIVVFFQILVFFLSFRAFPSVSIYFLRIS